MSETYVRFSARQRSEHMLVMVIFLLLALTGFPQKFSDAGWAQTLVRWMGGIELVRFVHRVSGIVFGILAFGHMVTALALVLTGRTRPTMVPARQDFRDAVKTLRYYLGLSDAQARFDRFDYRQKFEYWGMIMGGVLMVATGLILYFPIVFTRILPGQLIPIAKVAHSNEGLMAFLVVITWHIYNAHLNPDVFPFDMTIFTGKISRHRMEHEHPLELERLTGSGAAAPGGDGKGV